MLGSQAVFSNSLAEQPAWDTGHMDTSSWPAPYPLQEEQPPCEATIATCTEPSVLGSGHRDSGDPRSGAKAHMTRIVIEQQFGSRVCQSEAAVNSAGLLGYRQSKPGPWSSSHSTWQWIYQIQWTHRLSHIPSIPRVHEMSSLPLTAEESRPGTGPGKTRPRVTKCRDKSSRLSPEWLLRRWDGVEWDHQIAFAQGPYYSPSRFSAWPRGRMEDSQASVMPCPTHLAA